MVAHLSHWLDNIISARITIHSSDTVPGVGNINSMLLETPVSALTDPSWACVCSGGKQPELHRLPHARRDDTGEKSSLSDAIKERPHVRTPPLHPSNPGLFVHI